MTSRKLIVAGLFALLTTPALTYAASSGLSTHEIEQGQTQLLSQRAARVDETRARSRAENSRKVADQTDEQHRKAMETGTVRMTVGSMLGAKK